MTKVIDFRKRVFDRKIPAEDIERVMATLMANAEYVAKALLSGGQITVNLGLNNESKQFDLILKEVE